MISKYSKKSMWADQCFLRKLATRKKETERESLNPKSFIIYHII